MKNQQSTKILILIFVGLLSLVIGIKNVLAIDNSIAQFNPENLNLGKQLYIENCSSCHIPIAPQILPTDSWQNILNKSQNHYGESLPKINNLTNQLIWNYLRTYSRPSLSGERTPEYITNSRYLRAFHPQIDLPKPTNHQSCTTCHPKAAQLDYRTLSDDWDSLDVSSELRTQIN